MRRNSQLILAAWLSALSTVNCQFNNWEDSQVNTSICHWLQPRLRDTVYLDGGSIWWSPGFANGTIGEPVNNGDFQGYILSYNLSESFSADTNVTGILVKDLMSKARGGSTSGSSTEPNYYDGGMLANDAEFFLYGGALFKNDALYSAPSGDEVLRYGLYAYGPEKPGWQKGVTSINLNGGVTRYVAYGAAVNAPSENKAWYFSGLTSPTRGPIVQNSADPAVKAATISDTLIGLDMSIQLDEKWSNTTLPRKIRGRSNAEVVWVPVGKQGILVVLGGVVYPEWATNGHKSANETASQLQSPEFTRVIDIYDVATKEWYQQPAQGGPGARTRGCAVVAPASDFSSFNIYYYGGFDGIHPAKDFSDQVWVLSLPSFTWTLINEGRPRHARSGHKCFMPYPDQMIAFGGYTSVNGTSRVCLDSGPVVIFNLTSGQWMDTYSPSRYADYGVHSSVVKVVGGDASGGAKVTSPLPSGWSSTVLGDIFNTPYDKTRLKHFWPYANAPSPPASPGQPAPTVVAFGPGTSLSLRILLPVIIIPVIFASVLAAALWYFCVGRKTDTPFSTYSPTAMDSSRNIIMWLRGHRGSKQLTLAESHAIASELSSTGDTHVAPDVRHEMPDNQVSELCGASSPVELHGTGFVPINSANRRRDFAGSDVSHLSEMSQHGDRVTDNTSLASHRNSGLPPLIEKQRTDPPLAEARADLSIPVPRISAGTEALIRDFEKAVHEEANMNSPVSPFIASERFYNGFLSPGSMVGPLQGTLSEEVGDGAEGKAEEKAEEKGGEGAR
ncbi:hypothetical protein E4U42_000738 [Claviceps africana]|uniref:Galactose oxidase/kelch, beta-propeller n=1 Tax=Claviceps africana TaxID=83212 RepID=A0A8K0NFG3_9HYPO|nr:hypothetical protein E4U42_000738 [Claviceps africana]